MHRSVSLEDAEELEGTPVRDSFITKASAVRLVIASVATLSVIVGVLITRDTKDSSPPTNSDTPNSANASSPTAPPPAPIVASQQPRPFAVDVRGFLDRDARCAPTQSAVAVGRTEKSLVVICDVEGGRFEYKGLRLSLGIGVSVGDVTANADGFVARNEDITYVVTATELAIRSGDAVIAREPMVEYRGPQAVRAPAAPPPPPRPAAQPTLSLQAPPSPQSSNEPIAGYPLLPVTARGTGDGIVRFTATKPWQLRYLVDCPPNSAIRGSINAGASYMRYHVALQGAPNARVEGKSPNRDQMGPIVVSITLENQHCGWELSV
jgi:hypothetical protein